MTLLQDLKSQRKKEAAGSVLFETALMFPIFVFFLLFIMDLSRIQLAKGVLSDISYTTARAGAQSGAPGFISNGISRTAFDRALVNTPLSASDTEMTSLTPARCNNVETFVEVTTVSKIDFITPGLGALLSAGTDSANLEGEGYNISEKGISRCEVARL